MKKNRVIAFQFLFHHSLKDKTLNILSFLSESLHKDKDLFYDGEQIWQELSERGFSEEEIERALNHLERLLLESPGPFWSDRVPTYRVFSDEEKTKISKTGQGYLWVLKSIGVINHALEDEIIQKLMSLEEIVGSREIKTVAALTLFGYEHKSQNSKWHATRFESHERYH